MPSVSSATSVNIGCRRKLRMAKRRSCIRRHTLREHEGYMADSEFLIASAQCAQDMAP
jgi:hypothetical protein